MPTYMTLGADNLSAHYRKKEALQAKRRAQKWLAMQEAFQAKRRPVEY